MMNFCKVRNIYRAIAVFESEFHEKYGLSLNEGMLLCLLDNHASLTSGEVAEQLSLTPSNTSKVIRSVEDKKFIQRIIGKEDKRQMNLSITTKGKKQIESLKNQCLELPQDLQSLVDAL
ncbi:MarR family transcriptional regulator [Ornithobacterium rhinotracheale]|nr:MarR family transcriptional regulator [Ornithobacterium rhinotracheale]MRJ09541.1 MarR family transcriptional regulator [Ornithobacterium rhinotracheale]